ncbi:hypothetical protein OEA41_001326 [Lepraria neglecta]|uniref:Uncharacterized protein n=1 Tax=Lepraria neglecta TaxID=209136 RepID=A0AAD9ZC64_9LECA|nr:hypothetical protein OEA41_001326 [Lepraria neglecta]
MYLQRFLLFLVLVHNIGIASATPASIVATSTRTATPVLPLSPPQSSDDSNLQKAGLVIYNVPGTSTKIRFTLGRPLDKTAMKKTILTTYDFIYHVISTEGDGDLPPDEDPFLMNEHYGASIVASSAQGHKLTWELLKGAVVGLYNALYLKGIYKTASFEIWDGSLGIVGAGQLKMAYGAAASNMTSIALGNMTMDGQLEA